MPLPPPSAPHEEILRGGELNARGQVHVNSNARFQGEVECFLNQGEDISQSCEGDGA